MAAELRYTQDGLPYYEGVDLSWVDQTPQPILAATPSDPYEMAAARVALANKRGGKLPIAYPEAVKEQKPTSYIMEPDLLETQGGMRLPTDVNINDGGVPFNTTTGKDIPIVRRPNVLPIAFTPDGPTFAMPKMLDIVGNVMSPLIAGKVPVKAGEMVLGSGMVRTANEAVNQPFYSALERAVDTAKIDKADASQWMGYLKNQPGVKAEELSYVLGELPSGVINKEQLKGLMNKVELKEKVLGDDPVKKLAIELAEKENGAGSWERIGGGGQEHYWKDAEKQLKLKRGGDTKYHSYQLPGGENYKEMLLQIPEDKLPTGRYILSYTNEKGIKGSLAYNTRAEAVKAMEEGKASGHKNIDFDIKPEMSPDSLSNYKSSHWYEPNVLAHIRMNDRVVDGKKTLHLEEIQSDWHQAGRKQGYKINEQQINELGAIDEKLLNGLKESDIGNPDMAEVLKTAVEKKVITPDEARKYAEYSKGENSNIPDAPFKKTWDELALKRMLHKAAKEGYEGISWTPGEAQAARYDLSKQVKSIHWEPSIADKSHSLIQIHPNGGDVLKVQVDNKGKIVAGFPSSRTHQWEGKNLSDIVGKEHADKILGKKEGSLEGEGLKIGGEGMKAFYDKMLVDRANALGKKYGSKVEQREIISKDNILPEGGRVAPDRMHLLSAEQIASLKPIKQPIHYLPITPELRARANEGFPLFSNSPILTPVTHNPFNTDEKKKFKLVPVQGNPFQ